MHGCPGRRCFLTEDVAASIARAMVLSRLAYCNSHLLAVQSPAQQNSNAFKILVPGQFEHTTNVQLLQHLHWSHVYFRIKYKIATFTYAVVISNEPLYATYLLAPHIPGRSFRSQDKHLLLERAFSTVIGSRGFSYAAFSISNKLPLEIRNSSSFASIKVTFEHNIFRVCSQTRASPSFSHSDCPRLRFDPAPSIVCG